MANNQENILQLVGATISGEINGICAQIEINQRYVNKADYLIDALFHVPLDTYEYLGVVNEFEIEVGENHIVHSIIEKYKVAKELSIESIGKEDMIMIEKSIVDRKNMIGSVTNLAPNQEVIIKFSFTTFLSLDDERFRFILPLSFSPKQGDMADTSSIPYKLEIVDLVIKDCSQILKVESPTHQIQANIIKGEGIVSYHSEKATDKDLVLYIAIEDDTKESFAYVERYDDSLGCLISFYPEFDFEKLGQVEIIIALDIPFQSVEESYVEFKLQQIQKLTKKFLQKFPTDIYFNIISGGKEICSLFKQNSEIFSENTLKAALKFIDSNSFITNIREENHGIEELLGARQNKYPPKAEYFRQVILLTEGHTENSNSLFETVQNFSEQVRIFPLALGSLNNHSVIGEISNNTGGFHDYIYDFNDEQYIEKKIQKYLDSCLQPNVTPKILWEGIADIPCAPPLYSVFNKEPVYAFCFLPENIGELSPSTRRSHKKLDKEKIVPTNKDLLELKSILRVESGNNTHNFVAQIQEAIENKYETSSINSLVAKYFIENEISMETITDWSKKHHVLSKYTCFVGSSKNSENNPLIFEFHEGKDKEAESEETPLIATFTLDKQGKIAYSSEELMQGSDQHVDKPEDFYDFKERRPSFSNPVKPKSKPKNPRKFYNKNIRVKKKKKYLQKKNNEKK